MFTYIVGAPIIALLVAVAAWNGHPKAFGRLGYFICFVCAGAASALFMNYARTMRVDIRTGQYFVQFACLLAGALLLGVSLGCLLGVFTYRRTPTLKELNADR